MSIFGLGCLIAFKVILHSSNSFLIILQPLSDSAFWELKIDAATRQALDQIVVPYCAAVEDIRW